MRLWRSAPAAPCSGSVWAMDDGALRVRLAAPEPRPGALDSALAAAGLEVDPRAATGVVVSAGRCADTEVQALMERWIVDSTPHLLLAAHPHGVEVGPWVLPGVSPCGHCVAASTLCEPQPALPSLSPALWALAAGWAARDIQSWRRGETPSTWATSWLLGADPVPQSRRWLRHPYCGCAWFDL